MLNSRQKSKILKDNFQIEKSMEREVVVLK